MLLCQCFWLFVTSMLSYNQGLRYLYPLLPVLLLYAGYGFVRICGVVKKFIPGKTQSKKAFLAFCTTLTLLLCSLAAYPQYLSNAALYANGGVRKEDNPLAYNAFSPQAIEAYNHVRENVPEADVVGFFKPRLLYLNTQHLSVIPLEEMGHSLDECDWYLEFIPLPIIPELCEEFIPVWNNEDFKLYIKEA